MDLNALVGKQVHIVGVIKDDMDLPRPNESRDRVKITGGDLTRIGATSVSTVAENRGTNGAGVRAAAESDAGATLGNLAPERTGIGTRRTCVQAARRRAEWPGLMPRKQQ